MQWEYFTACKWQPISPRFPAVFPKVPKGDHSSFWSLSYEPLLLCSVNSSTNTVLTHPSLIPVPHGCCCFSQVCFTGKSKHAPLSFIPQGTTNIDPFCIHHFTKGLMMKYGSHIPREETELNVRQPISGTHHPRLQGMIHCFLTLGCSLLPWGPAMVLSLPNSGTKTLTRADNGKIFQSWRNRKM